MAMMAPATMAATTVAMMVAMMLPSIAPTIWRHHRHLRATRTPRAARRTMLFVAGYASVWSVIGLALYAVGTGLSPAGMASLTEPPFARWTAAGIVLGAGALQCSPWKAKQLLRCRHACVTEPAPEPYILAAWREGCALGMHCSLSCAAPMTILLVAGLMNVRVMLVISAAITAERVAPAGVRVARLTGALALLAGSLMCVWP